MFQSVSKRRPDGEGRSDYATHLDFCAAFREHLDNLFLLALLLTGDELSAEKCFLTAFDTCVQQSLIFKESAASWSRRSVIKAAIRLLLPVRSDPSRPRFPGNDNNMDLGQDAPLKSVQRLPLFDRCVFVMSVLEGCSDRECALLLNCSSADILSARIRAFQQIPRTEKRYSDHSMANQPYIVDPDWLECG